MYICDLQQGCKVLRDILINNELIRCPRHTLLMASFLNEYHDTKNNTVIEAIRSIPVMLNHLHKKM